MKTLSEIMSEKQQPKPLTTSEMASQTIKTLLTEKEITDAINGSKSAYIKANIFNSRKLFWDAINADMASEDPQIRQKAYSEYNKLLCRMIPTEITSPEDGGLIVNVRNFTREGIVQSLNEEDE